MHSKIESNQIFNIRNSLKKKDFLRNKIVKIGVVYRKSFGSESIRSVVIVKVSFLNLKIIFTYKTACLLNLQNLLTNTSSYLLFRMTVFEEKTT